MSTWQWIVMTLGYIFLGEIVATVLFVVTYLFRTRKVRCESREIVELEDLLTLEDCRRSGTTC